VSTGPLHGITIVDLTRVLAGPYCTMVLSDLGARVIKVERPGVGDDARYVGPFIGDVSAYFASLNRGKESVALDLRDPAHRARFDALLADADVLVGVYIGCSANRSPNTGMKRPARTNRPNGVPGLVRHMR
jgi:CoA:oxalate CoA-transferase